MGFFSRKIEVTLIDDRSGGVIGVTKLAPDDLPASFFASTTMHVGDAEWSVVAADPVTRDRYSATRKLVLRLRPIERIDPGDLLYTLPTICDPLPGSEGSDADGREVVLREDDWRQLELVSAGFGADVEQELGAIRAIHEHERVGMGFRNLHVRSRLPRPIEDGRISLEDVRALVGGRLSQPLRFDGVGKQISDGIGFSFEGGSILYGICSGTHFEILGLRSASADNLVGLKAFAAQRDLLVVDWCRCVAAHPDDASFDSLVNRAG